MAYKIFISEAAKDDTEIAFNYYEDQREGLGEKFLEELEKRYNDLSTSPHNYGFIDDRALIRDIKIERFPYVIIFEIIDDSIQIYSVFCTYQHPKRILRKLP
ncbi:MAG: type II toxin-antitoxin system RelE/ParE family toxin [Bacteroidetes bacterium]|nr:type II toxin-antitoxin system RelE/ParE family toxin [Bacteroidota bacterium]